MEKANVKMDGMRLSILMQHENSNLFIAGSCKRR